MSATRNWRSPSVNAISSYRAARKSRAQRRPVALVDRVVDDADEVGMGRGQHVGDRGRSIGRAVVDGDDLEDRRQASAASRAPRRRRPRGSPPRCGPERRTTAGRHARGPTVRWSRPSRRDLGGRRDRHDPALRPTTRVSIDASKPSMYSRSYRLASMAISSRSLPDDIDGPFAQVGIDHVGDVSKVLVEARAVVDDRHVRTPTVDQLRIP